MGSTTMTRVLFFITLVCTVLAKHKTTPTPTPTPVTPTPVTPTPSTSVSVTVNSFSDVCSICTSSPYDNICTSNANRRCKAAMRAYMLSQTNNIPICSCYATIASQLLRTCPGAAFGISFISNCDSACGYGIPCPFKSSLVALLNSSNAVPAPSTPRALTAYAALAITFPVNAATKTATVCYEVVPGSGVTSIAAARIRPGVPGVSGSSYFRLFSRGSRPNKVGTYTGCVAVDRGTVMGDFGWNPSNFYLDIDANGGSANVRGQLVTSAHLYTTLSTADGKGKFDVDIAPQATAVSFNAQPSSSSSVLSSISSLFIGQAISAFVTIPLIQFFGPAGGTPSLHGATSASAGNVQTVLAKPSEVFLAATSPGSKGTAKAFLSQTTSLLTVASSKNVVPFSLTSSSAAARISLTVGGGELCYSVKTYGAVGTITGSNVYQGVRGKPADALFPLFTGAGPLAACVSLDVDIATAILGSPSGYFVQILTNESPFGAVRGQLSVSG